MRSTHQKFALALVLGLVLGLVALPGCHKGPSAEDAQAQLERAKAQYAELVQRGVPPASPAYDAVIAAFEAVPQGTPARREADSRLATLRALRGTRPPPPPLAVPGATGPGTDAVDAQRAACEALAKKLGTSPEAQREAVRRELTACHEKLVRLEAHSHPLEGEPPDAGR